VAGASVGASVGISVAGASVAGGASVVGAAQAVIIDRTVTDTIISKTNFLLFADITSSPIILYYLSPKDSEHAGMICRHHLLSL
jgi:hypothetical protein